MPERTTRRLPLVEVEPWGGLGRLIMGIGGGLLIVLFFCPWHGVSLVAAPRDPRRRRLRAPALLPDRRHRARRLRAPAVAVRLPRRRRHAAWRRCRSCSAPAASSTAGAAWSRRWRSSGCRRRTFCARARSRRRRRACSCSRRWRRWRCSTWLPVSSVVPIVVIFKMMSSGFGAAIFAVFLLVPLMFAGLSLLGVLGRDLTDMAVLLVGADPVVGAGGGRAARDHDRRRHAALRRPRPACGLRRRRPCRWRSCCRWPRRAPRASDRRRLRRRPADRGLRRRRQPRRARPRRARRFDLRRHPRRRAGLGRAVPPLRRRARRAPPRYRTIVIPVANPDGLARRPQEQRARRRPQPQLRRAQLVARAPAGLRPRRRCR